MTPPKHRACSLRHRAAFFAAFCTLATGAPSAAEIRRDPNGVNVNSQAATTVFITFGGLANQVPVEAFWCGELVPAAPDRGQKCAPGSIFGRLPVRFDQSRQQGSTFTDIMSIPPSVARRAYQAAEAGARSSFFYVRRFVSTVGGPDEYVFVTCRMAGGGARVPFSLLDVQLRFAGDATVLAVERGAVPPPLEAQIAFNGTGRLQGRWEVVLPGDEPPASRDLLTEATLPPDERPLQRRYTELGRFNVFLPPTGRYVLPGPDPSRLPTQVDGLYQLLLRVEASNDKEADSNLALAGAGTGIVHSGAVAGFPLPVLRYFVGSVPARSVGGGVALLAPAPGAAILAGVPVAFSWSAHPAAALYRLEVAPPAGEQPLFAAVVQQGILTYRAPGFLAERAVDGRLRWRVVALSPAGDETAASPWQELVAGPASPANATLAQPPPPMPPPGGRR